MKSTDDIIRPAISRGVCDLTRRVARCFPAGGRRASNWGGRPVNPVTLHNNRRRAFSCSHISHAEASASVTFCPTVEQELTSNLVPKDSPEINLLLQRFLIDAVALYQAGALHTFCTLFRDRTQPRTPLHQPRGSKNRHRCKSRQ